MTGGVGVLCFCAGLVVAWRVRGRADGAEASMLANTLTEARAEAELMADALGNATSERARAIEEASIWHADAHRWQALALSTPNERRVAVLEFALVEHGIEIP